MELRFEEQVARFVFLDYDDIKEGYTPAEVAFHGVKHFEKTGFEFEDEFRVMEVNQLRVETVGKGLYTATIWLLMGSTRAKHPAMKIRIGFERVTVTREKKRY